MTSSLKEQKRTANWIRNIGVGLIFLGLILILLVSKFSVDQSLTFGNMLSLCLSLCSLGLGLYAMSEASAAGVKSDINSNENFLRIVDHFEDKRIEITQSLAKPDFSVLTRDIYKMLTYSRRAIKLYEMENINKENFDLFFEQLTQFLFVSRIPWEGIPKKPTGKNFVLRKQDIINVELILEIFTKFKLDEKQQGDLEKHMLWIMKIRDMTP